MKKKTSKAERAEGLKKCLKGMKIGSTKELLESTYRVYWEDSEADCESALWFEAKPVAASYDLHDITLYFPPMEIILNDMSAVTVVVLGYTLRRGWYLVADQDRDQDGKYTIDENVEVEINP